MNPAVSLEGARGKSGGPDRLADWLPEILLLVVTTAAGILARGRWIDPTGDPGLWWSLSARLSEGERYYRDLPLQFGPLSPYLLGLGVRIFGFSVRYVLLANWLPAILACLLVLRAGRGYLSNFERLSVLGLVLGAGLFAPGPGRLVYPYSPAAVHALCFSVGALLLARGRGGAVRAGMWPGLLAGLAFSAKQEIGVAAIVSLLFLSWIDPGRRSRRVAAVAASFLIVVLASALFALSSAPLESLRGESHLWPLAAVPPAWTGLYGVVAGVREAGWPRRVAESVSALAFYVALVALLGVWISGDRGPRRWIRPAIVLALSTIAGFLQGAVVPVRWSPASLSMLAAFLAAILAFADRACPGREFLAAFGLFSGLVASRTAFSSDAGQPYAGVAHLCAALSWALLLLVLLPRVLPGGGAAVRTTRRIWAYTLLPIAWIGAARGFESLREPFRVPVDSRVGRFFVAPRQAGLHRAMAQNLRPGERVAVLPESNAVDVIYGLRSASRYLILLPGTLDEGVERRLLREFREKPPDAVVVFERPTGEYGVEPLGRGFGRELMRWIRGRYRIAASTPAGQILRPVPREGPSGRYNLAP